MAKSNKEFETYYNEKIKPIYNDLYRFIFSICKNKSNTEDALHNTIINSYAKIDSVKDKKNIKNWLFSIAKNECLIIIKSSEREILTKDNSFFDIIDHSTLTEKIVDTKELRTDLLDIINSLNDEERDLIILRYYCDLKLGYIANILNISNSAVRLRHKRLKQKLLKKLIKKKALEDSIP